MSIDPTRDPHARIVVKPLPSQVAAAKAKAAESAEAAGGVGAAEAAGGVGTAGVGAKTAGGPAAASGVGAAGVGATAAGTTGLVPPPSASPRIASSHVAPDDPFLRAANEDDDGYDPYSDRPAPPEPLFSEDPWA